jgi:hypothetical protein
LLTSFWGVVFTVVVLVVLLNLDFASG